MSTVVHFHINISVTHCFRAGHDGGDITDAEASVSSLWPMVFDCGFRVREADAETDGKCHRGQARRARQEPDGQRFEREIRVFPALAQTYTQHDDTCTLEACLGESVGFMERSDSGTEEITQSRL